MTKVLQICDLVNPESGLSYREENRLQSHNIPLFSLVEVVGNPASPGPNDGMRLFVQRLGRDCDQTPLYWLTLDYKVVGHDLSLGGNKTEHELMLARLKGGSTMGGYREESLVVIRSAEDVIAAIEEEGWHVRDGKFSRD